MCAINRGGAVPSWGGPSLRGAEAASSGQPARLGARPSLSPFRTRSAPDLAYGPQPLGPLTPAAVAAAAAAAPPARAPGCRAPGFASCQPGARCAAAWARLPDPPRPAENAQTNGRTDCWRAARRWRPAQRPSLPPPARPQPLFLGAARPASRAPRICGDRTQHSNRPSQCPGAPPAFSSRKSPGPRPPPTSEKPPGPSIPANSFKKPRPHKRPGHAAWKSLLPPGPEAAQYHILPAPL